MVRLSTFVFAACFATTTSSNAAFLGPGENFELLFDFAGGASGVTLDTHPEFASDPIFSTTIETTVSRTGEDLAVNASDTLASVDTISTTAILTQSILEGPKGLIFKYDFDITSDGLDQIQRPEDFSAVGPEGYRLFGFEGVSIDVEYLIGDWDDTNLTVGRSDNGDTIALGRLGLDLPPQGSLFFQTNVQDFSLTSLVETDIVIYGIFNETFEQRIAAPVPIPLPFGGGLLFAALALLVRIRCRAS